MRLRDVMNLRLLQVALILAFLALPFGNAKAQYFEDDIPGSEKPQGEKPLVKPEKVEKASGDKIVEEDKGHPLEPDEEIEETAEEREREREEQLETFEKRVEELNAALNEYAEKSEAYRKRIDEVEKVAVEEKKKRLDLENRVVVLEGEEAKLRKEIAEREKRAVDIHAHAALDFGLYQDADDAPEDWENGFILREVEISVGKEFDDLWIEAAPEYNGYRNEISIRSAFFDFNIISRKTPKGSVKAGENERGDIGKMKTSTTWKPALRFGRRAEWVGRRNDSHLALQAGKFDLPIGIHNQYDRAHHRFSVSAPLPVEGIYGREGAPNDLGIMLYGSSKWVNYSLFGINGRLHGLGFGGRIGLTALDWMELAVDYRYETNSKNNDVRYQLLLGEVMMHVWRFEILGQYTWEEEKTYLDQLFNYGGHGELRVNIR